MTAPLVDDTAAPIDLDAVPQRTLAREDGVTIAYFCIGDGPRTLLLANGLGGRFYAWEPLVRALQHGFRLVTWDYRGLFRSSSPERRRHMSIPRHAEDGRAILDDLGVERAVLCGWSMGVQVSLELATLHPERTAGLVLLNGTYGHAFASGLQPLVPFPLVGRWGHRLIEYLLDHPELGERLATAYEAMMTPTLGLFWLMSRTPASRTRALLERYRRDVFAEANFINYLRLFQELDAHSTYHHLRDIDAPALVVSGQFDLLTPAYQSREIARRLRNAELLALRRASHFVLIERPDTVVPAIERFLAERARW